MLKEFFFPEEVLKFMTFSYVFCFEEYCWRLLFWGLWLGGSCLFRDLFFGVIDMEHLSTEMRETGNLCDLFSGFRLGR